MFLDFLWKKRKKQEVSDEELNEDAIIEAILTERELSGVYLLAFVLRVLKMFNAKRTAAGLYVEVSNTPFRINYFDFFVTQLDPEDTFRLLVIASFNKDARVREKVAATLALIRNPKSIRYLLYLLSDSELSVRDAAETGLRSYLTDEYRPVFVAELAFVQRLNLAIKSDFIHDFILAQEATAEFYNSLTSSDRGRLIYIKMKLATQPLTAYVADLMLKDRADLIRSELINHLDQLSPDDRREIIRRLLTDSSAMVKSKALAWINNAITEFHEIIYNLASDTSAMVRGYARSLLKASNYDWHAIYNDQIKNNVRIIGSLSGLADVGTRDDIDVFKQYIDSPRKKVRKVCVASIEKLSEPVGS